MTPIHTQTEQNSSPKEGKKKRRQHPRWRYFIYLLIILGILLVTFTVKASVSGDESIWSHLAMVNEKYIKPTFSFGSTLAALTASAEDTLKGMDEDRVNVLLLGIGGRGHDGGSLTDTIIVASYQPSTNHIAMMSIPRDLSVPIPGYGWRKINAVYALAEYNEPGTGGPIAAQAIGEIFDIEIPYYLRIDFAGFEEVVDLVGGVDVIVPNTLSDYQYPIPGREDYPDDQRYEHVYIEEGAQHFDGDTALKYVRSRHGINGEGSDFARAARQQIVIEALTDKIISFSTLLRPGKIKKIIANVEENIDMNLTLEDIVAFAKLAKGYLDQENTSGPNNVVLDNQIDGPLRAANYNGAFVLEPRVGDFSELQFIANNIFDPEAVFDSPIPTHKPATPTVEFTTRTEANEDATIEILNGTFVQGLAGANRSELESLGYDVVKVGNTTQQDEAETIIYDLSDGKFPATIDFLSKNYTENITNKIPLGISSEADILIVLGLDVAF